MNNQQSIKRFLPLHGCVALAMLFTVSAVAQNNDEDDALLTMIALLETDISTKTDLRDQDYQPGLVTVLTGEELIARGARDVGEAINLVAGLHLPSEPNTAVIRGIGGLSGFATGKTKFLINGIAMDTVFSSEERSILPLSIEHVERIEIIRGPGSSVYGGNAYLGVINVVTHKTGSRVFARYESFNTGLLGGMFAYQHANGGNSALQISTSFSDGPDLDVPADGLAALGQAAVSNAPGQSNEKSRQTVLLYNYQMDSFSLGLQWIDTGTGDGFGVRNFLPSDSDRIAIEQTELSIDAAYKQQHSEHTTLDYFAQYRQNRRDFDEVEGLPAGAFGIYPTTQIASSSDGEDRLGAGIDLTYRGIKGHTILLGLEAVHAEAANISLRTNIDLNNNIPGTPFPFPLPGLTPFPLGYEDRDRDILGIYLQDEFRLGEKIDITAGVRFDDYSDVGSNTSPRLAAVYRHNDRNLFKVQYAEAFRPPTFVELYSVANTFVGNPDIVAETIRTAEASYIFKTDKSVFRTTVYHSLADDLIALDQNLRYQNLDEVTSRGVEFEIERVIGDAFKVSANLSLNETEDDATGEPLAGSVDQLATLSLIYQPISRYSLVTDILVTGDRNRGAIDPRTELDGQTVVNLTFNWFDVGVAGVDLRLGVYNLLDEDVADPAPVGTYPFDYPAAGRAVSISLIKRI
ncbi:MAG: TonB-dependent receptor [Pseudomonadota bacterium]